MHTNIKSHWCTGTNSISLLTSGIINPFYHIMYIPAQNRLHFIIACFIFFIHYRFIIQEEPCLQNSSPASGHFGGIIPVRSNAILPEGLFLLLAISSHLLFLLFLLLFNISQSKVYRLAKCFHFFLAQHHIRLTFYNFLQIKETVITAVNCI